MTKFIAQIRRLILLAFWWQHHEPQKLQKPQPQPRKQERIGPLYYLDDLLEQLDDYFRAVRWLRFNDQNTYDLYQKIGGQVVTDKINIFDFKELTPRWRNGIDRPAFGMIHFGDPTPWAKKDDIYPRFLYFHKLKRKADVQQTKFDLYELVSFVVDHKNTKFRIPIVHYLSVDPTGTISLLKQRIAVKHKIHPKKINGRKSAEASFTTMEWRVPEFIYDLCRDSKERTGEDITPTEMVKNLFCAITSACENASAGIQVRVSRGDLCAMFHIDLKRTPYFFKDRQKTVNTNGRTKRIFHIVRPHLRANGTAVRFHFRGLRKFQWNGYDVLVTMPGWHHRPLLEFSHPAFEEGDPKIKNEKIIDSKGVSAILAKHIQSDKWFAR